MGESQKEPTILYNSLIHINKISENIFLTNINYIKTQKKKAKTKDLQ